RDSRWSRTDKLSLSAIPKNRATCPTPSPSSTPHKLGSWCCTRTSLTQKCQDIVDGIQKMDALERAAHHEFETAVRGASGAERQQSLCTLRGVRRLAADGYKWLRRYRELGPLGLVEQSRRPD